jgi:hypothetical protein
LIAIVVFYYSQFTIHSSLCTVHTSLFTGVENPPKMNFKRTYPTGFWGSGKTTVGRVLDNLLPCSIIDFDENIGGYR